MELLAGRTDVSISTVTPDNLAHELQTVLAMRYARAEFDEEATASYISRIV
jgi:hypothetical protein